MRRLHLSFPLSILLWLASWATAQAQRLTTNFTDLYPVQRRYAPVLDSSLNVAKLSRSDRNKLIEKLFEVDQVYRRPTNNVCWTPGSKEARCYNNLMAINDPVNQTLLLKILKLDGWPCDLGNGENSLSYKAWFIVWHNRGAYEGMSRFHRYLEKANASNCISKMQFKQVNDVLNQVRTFRKGFSSTR